MYNGGLLIETRTPTVVTVSEMHAYKTCLFTNKKLMYSGYVMGNFDVSKDNGNN